jgi:hypothetical protein
MRAYHRVASVDPLFLVLLARRIGRKFGRRHAEDEPSVAGIHVFENENVAHKRSIGLGIGAAERMCAPMMRLVCG